MFVNDAGVSAALLAPFGPGGTRVAPEAVGDVEGLEALVRDLAGVFAVRVPKALCPGGEVAVAVSRFRDFKPAGVVDNCAWLRRLREVADKAGETSPAALAEAYGDLPLDFSAPAEAAAPAAKQGSGEAAVEAVLEMVAAPEPASPATRRASRDLAEQARSLMSGVLAAVFADPAFRAAEAAWTCARRMLAAARGGVPLEVRLVSVGRDQVEDALEALGGLFPKIPPNLVLADVAMDAAPARMEVWSALAKAGDALLCPAAAAVSPGFFHLGAWDGLGRVNYIKNALEDAAFAKWRRFAQTPESGWAAALVNEYHVRAAYGPDNPARPVPFVEAEPLAANPVWALGEAAALSLCRSGWPHLATLGRGAALENLAVSGGRETPVRAALSDERALEFADAGLTPLSGRLGGDRAFFRSLVAVDGSDLAAKLFLSRVLGFFFRRRAMEDIAPEFAADAAPDVIAKALAGKFSLFFEQTGHAPPLDLEITAEPAGRGTALRIRFTPPATLAAGSSRLDLGFVW